MEAGAVEREIATLRQEVRELAAALEAKERENTWLRDELARLRARLYGPRSGRLSPGQLDWAS